MTYWNKKWIGASVFAVLALIVAAGVAVMNPSATYAQAPTPTPSATAPEKKPLLNQDHFLQNFATRLGVTIEKLKEAYQAAFNDTVDQAVQNGTVTQDQASKMKESAAQKGMPFAWFGGKGHDKPGASGKAMPMDAFRGKGFGMLSNADLAKALNMTEADLTAALKSGKSIADVAKEKGVDLAGIKTTILNNAKAQLDQAVKDGKLTQARADEMYKRIESSIDTLLTQTHGARPTTPKTKVTPSGS